MKRKNAADVLKAAKKLLVNVGWSKGRMTQQTSSGEIVGYCALGAINAVPSAETAKDQAFCHMIQLVGRSVVMWNDNKKTTKKQVLKVFDQAIANAEEKK